MGRAQSMACSSQMIRFNLNSAVKEDENGADG